MQILRSTFLKLSLVGLVTGLMACGGATSEQPASPAQAASSPTQVAAAQSPPADAPSRPAKVSGHPEWSPIMYRSGDAIDGAGPALVRMIFDDLGLAAEFPFAGTWDEVQAKARSGDVDLLVAAYKTTEREQYMSYSDAYTTDPVALFVKAGSEFDFANWDALIGKKGVGTVGDSYGQAFDDFIKEKLDVTIAQSSSEAFDMVAAGKADYFIYSLFAGEREIAAQNRTGQTVSLPQFVTEESFYITISKLSEYGKYLPEINRLIANYVDDGTVARLIDEYRNR